MPIATVAGSAASRAALGGAMRRDGRLPPNDGPARLPRVPGGLGRREPAPPGAPGRRALVLQRCRESAHTLPLPPPLVSQPRGAVAGVQFVAAAAAGATGAVPWAASLPGIVRMRLMARDSLLLPQAEVRLFVDGGPSWDVVARGEVSVRAAAAAPDLLAQPLVAVAPGAGSRGPGVADGRTVLRPPAGASRVLAGKPAPGCDFRHGLAACLRPGDCLYEVSAAGERVGDLVLTSDFVASAFGDAMLHFGR